MFAVFFYMLLIMGISVVRVVFYSCLKKIGEKVIIVFTFQQASFRISLGHFKRDGKVIQSVCRFHDYTSNARFLGSKR